MARHPSSPRPTAQYWRRISLLLLASNFVSLWQLLPTSQRVGRPKLVGATTRGVVYGNAEHDGVDTKRWFIGNFIPIHTGRTFHSIEIKWSVNQRGDTNGEIASNTVAHTVAVLVQGAQRFEFAKGNVTLIRPGDYVLWRPGVQHTWTALRHSTVIVVRWPSRKHDQTISAQFEKRAKHIAD